MRALILEQSVIDQLKAVEIGAEVRDRQGNLIGYFNRAVGPHKVDHFECPISEEELLRRVSESGGRPLADILDDLRKLS